MHATAFQPPCPPPPCLQTLQLEHTEAQQEAAAASNALRQTRQESAAVAARHSEAAAASHHSERAALLVELQEVKRQLQEALHHAHQGERAIMPVLLCCQAIRRFFCTLSL